MGVAWRMVSAILAFGFIAGCEQDSYMGDYRDGKKAGTQLRQTGKPVSACEGAADVWVKQPHAEGAFGDRGLFLEGCHAAFK